jgi:hypothetical protein
MSQIDKVSNILSDSERGGLVLWPGESQDVVCIGVSRGCISTTLGPAPRKIDFPDNTEFHDAHYKYMHDSKELATQILESLLVKHPEFKGHITIDAWDKPSLELSP